MSYKFLVSIEDNAIRISDCHNISVYDGCTNQDVNFAVKNFIEKYLNFKNDILYIATNLSNFNYAENLNATRELMNLFDKVAKAPLNTNDDYIKMYDDNFYTYKTWDDLIKSEQEQPDGLTEEECKQELNKTIWQLPCGWFVQYV